MSFQAVVFYILSAILIFAGFRVVTAKNPVHAALYLVLAFFTASGHWLLLQAEFLAIALVLVYVGAVMVLFLFVVMMLDMDKAPLRQGYVRYLPVGLVVAVLMLVQMLALIGVRSAAQAPLADNAAVATDIPNITWLARALFTDFMLPFEVAAVILTVAVVAAVMLTLRRRPGAKHQNPAEQVRVKAADRVRMVKMQAAVPAAQAKPEEGAQ